MDIFAIKSRIIVTCSNRMSPFVEQEIRDAGLNIEQVFKTGVALEGNMQDCILLNLRLRSAGQVLFSIRHFFAEDANELYNAIRQIPWEDLIEGDGYFSVTSHVRNDSISNQLFANVKVKDAIVDRFRDRTGARPNSGPALDQAVVHLHWVGRDAEIF
ncbi:MAG TPA: THUMP domain-containing protein [Ferruginibacter sp.]|nr:THUMP domain-containing protein [Ferruginibacter sp.]